MRKADEANDPKSCWNKARPEQKVFVLLDSDPAAADAIRSWADERVHLGLNKFSDAKIIEALALADEIDALSQC